MGLFSNSFDPVTDLPDLSGKVIIVTGGNAGIGYATVKHLARKGAKVYMAARSKTRAEEAITKLKAEGLAPGNGEVIWLELDLVDPRNAKKAAQEFMAKEKRLDVLIHNAAILLQGYQLTPDGVEEQFLVNVISPFVLTRDLRPILDQTAAEPNSDVRIIVVASEAHKLVSGKPSFKTIDDLNNTFKSSVSSHFSRYGFTKLANILYARELQRKLLVEDSPITVISLHPGAVNTFTGKPQLRYVGWLVKLLIYPFFAHPDAGAYTSVFAAASPEIAQQREKYMGTYLVPVGKIQQTTEAAASEELGKQMWETFEKFLAEKDI